MVSSDPRRPPPAIAPAIDDDPTSELASTFFGTVRAVFPTDGAIATLQRVVDLAVETIDGCDFAGIFVLDQDQVTTPVGTDPLVLKIDALQHRAGEGPCLDAITHNATFYAFDLADDARWARFGPQATTAGIRSALGLHLSANGTRGALNLYARYPNAFGVIDRAKGVLLAALAGVAVTAAEGNDDQTRRSDDLQGALATREVIGQAQGILIERERITADQAFDILRRASQHLNLKLRDVAQTLVDTGENPQTGPRPSTYDSTQRLAGNNKGRGSQTTQAYGRRPDPDGADGS